jgi:hypothetical protein
MTDTVEVMIQARFDAVANLTDGRDWSDVLARAGLKSESATRRRSPRRAAFRWRLPARVALVAAVLVLATLVTAVAMGWPHRIIDFFSSPPAPTKVQKWFAFDNATAPPGMNPHAVSGETRKVMTTRFERNGREHTLYVAPRKGGGFCELWSGADGGCAPAKSPRSTAESRAAGPLGVSWTSVNNDPPMVIDGFVRVGATQTVEARFADGATAPIHVTWVSAPINAGFFVYIVPKVHRALARALRSVVALDAQGRVVGRERAPSRPTWHPRFVSQSLPDGTRTLLPRTAELANARRLFSFRATNGSRVFLWIVPLTGGGVCEVDNLGEGCGPSVPAFNGGLYGGLRSRTNRVLFAGQTTPEVATVVLRYENGESERLTPIHGLVVHDINPAHYKRGTRLLAAIAFGRSGKAIFTEHFRPQDPFTYPCQKPLSLGHGVQKCP